MAFVAGAGRINIDMVYEGLERLPQEGEEVFARHFTQQMGGGIPATLANLHQLGVPVHLQTAYGTDLLSQFACGVLERFGARPVNLYAGEGSPYNLTTVLLTPGQRSFVTQAASFPVTAQVDALVYENSTGAKLAQIGLASLDVYRRLKSEGTALLYDTSLREGLTLENYAPILTLADYYTPNDQEAMRLTGADSVSQAANVLADFFETVIIKLGKQGCLLFRGGKYKIVPAIPCFLHVDATGAGDAFMAGLLYGLYHGYSVEESVLLGNITGGKCVTAVGCLNAVCGQEELLALFGQYRDQYLAHGERGWKLTPELLRA